MRLRLFFSTILVLVDYVMIVLSALAAYFIRFESVFVELKPAVSIIPYNWYFLLSFTIPIGWLLIFALSGLYKIEERRFFDDIAKIIFACSTGTMLVIALIFFNREFFASRFVVLAVWVLSCIFVIFGRALINFIHHLCKKKGAGVLYVAIIGKGKNSSAIKEEYEKNKSLGRHVIFFANQFDDFARCMLRNLKNQGKLEEIILAEKMKEPDYRELLLFCEENRLRFKYSADVFSSAFKNFDLLTVAGVPLVEIKRTRLDGWGKIYKRIFDIVGSFCLLAVFSPIMLLTAIAIKLERKNKGPVFWSELDDGRRAKRVGEDGRLFNYFKFRSMKHKTHNLRYNELANMNERKGTPMVKIKNDPRITSVGRFIRRYSIDELPELFLVLFGRMSLVGPRPHLPEEVENYQGRHKQVLLIKPGITGLTQISGRADLDFEEEVRLDKYYIENWSIGMDIYILLKTPKAVLSKRGAY